MFKHAVRCAAVGIMILAVGCTSTSMATVEVQPQAEEIVDVEPVIEPVEEEHIEGMESEETGAETKPHVEEAELADSKEETSASEKDAAPPEDTTKPPTTWLKTISKGYDIVCRDVILAPKGGYYLIGTTNIAFEPVRDGDIILIRVDEQGEVVWEAVYGGDTYETGQSIILTKDGYLMIGGVVDYQDGNGMQAYLLKVDLKGNQIWSHAYGGPKDEFVNMIAQSPDGGFMLIGNSVDPDDFVTDPGVAGYGGFEHRSSMLVIKTDADGSEVWSQVFDNGENVLTTAGHVMPDGSALVLASIIYFPDDDDDVILVKVDPDGNEVWTRTWTEGTTSAYDFIPTSDGNFLITTTYSSSENAGVFEADHQFIKINPDGEEVWRKVFGDPDMIDYGAVLSETADGGYVSVGEWNVDLYHADSDISIIKLDQDGEVVWKNLIEADTHIMYGSMLTHPDGGFVIAGTMYNQRVADILLVKTNAKGHVKE